MLQEMPRVADGSVLNTLTPGYVFNKGLVELLQHFPSSLVLGHFCIVGEQGQRSSGL